MKDTGINRYRVAGDLLKAFDTSASTKLIPSKLLNPIAAHSFEEQAANRSDPTRALEKVANDGSI